MRRLKRIPFTRRRSGGLILDTNVLIDGRILALAESGFMAEPVIIPRFIQHELELLRDSQDDYKRERSLAGMECLQDLLRIHGLRVLLDTYPAKYARHIDDKLIALAVKRRAKLVTADQELSRRAAQSGITVLNINELAMAFRPKVLPGDTVSLQILRPGDGPGQGIGYFNDGTLVIVSQARDHVGQTVSVRITKYLQTDAGKMAFASLLPAKA